MKKWLALLTATMMVLTLCACGPVSDFINNTLNKPDDVLTPETLEGKWVMKMDLASLLETGALGDISELTEGVDFSEMDIQAEMGVTFQDGKLSLNSDDMARLYQDVVDSTLAWLIDGDNLLEMLSASDGGMAVEAFKEYLEQSGTTKEAIIELIKSTLPDSDTIIAEMREDGALETHYELVEDKLYTWETDGDVKDEDTYMLLSYSDGIISIVETVANGVVIRYDADTLVLVRE